MNEDEILEPGDSSPENELPPEDAVPASTDSDAGGDDDVEGSEGPPAELEAESNPLEARFATLESRQRDLEMENTYLRGVVSARQEPQAAEPKTDEAEILRGLQNPVTTIPTLRKFMGDQAAELRKEFSTGIKQSTQLADSVTKDREMALSRYPELRSDPKLAELATNIYNTLRQTTGQEHVPGGLTLAAGYAVAEMTRLKAQAPKPAPRTNVVRNIADPKVRGSQRSPIGAPRDVFAGWSRDDREAAERTCKKFGISAEEFVKNYDEAKKGRSSYGVG